LRPARFGSPFNAFAIATIAAPVRILKGHEKKLIAVARALFMGGGLTGIDATG
jgi:hypothetical protein